MSAEDYKSFLKKINKKLEIYKNDRAKCEGKIETLFEKLKEFNLNSTKDAKDELKNLDCELEKLENILKDQINFIKEKLESYEI